MVGENWRAVPGYEGVYEVSDRGRVRVLDRVIRFKKREKILHPASVAGYPAITLTAHTGTRRQAFIHRLVAAEFVHNPDPARLKYVNHRDNDRTNPLPYNLEWCTFAENRLRAVAWHAGRIAKIDPPVLGAEQWTPVGGYLGIYEISNHARARVLAREVEREKPGHFLIPDQDRDGYLRVTLTNSESKSQHFGIHALVALAFIPNPHGLREVAHIDHNRRNNIPDNLKWASRSGNHADSVIENRYALAGPGIGTKRTFTADEIRSIRARFAAGEQQSIIAKSLGLRHEQIRKIVMRERWKHVE